MIAITISDRCIIVDAVLSLKKRNDKAKEKRIKTKKTNKNGTQLCVTTGDVCVLQAFRLSCSLLSLGNQTTTEFFIPLVRPSQITARKFSLTIGRFSVPSGELYAKNVNNELIIGKQKKESAREKARRARDESSYEDL